MSCVPALSAMQRSPETYLLAPIIGWNLAGQNKSMHGQFGTQPIPASVIVKIFKKFCGAAIRLKSCSVGCTHRRNKWERRQATQMQHVGMLGIVLAQIHEALTLLHESLASRTDQHMVLTHTASTSDLSIGRYTVPAGSSCIKRFDLLCISLCAESCKTFDTSFGCAIRARPAEVPSCDRISRIFSRLGSVCGLLSSQYDKPHDHCSQRENAGFAQIAELKRGGGVVTTTRKHVYQSRQEHNQLRQETQRSDREQTITTSKWRIQEKWRRMAEERGEMEQDRGWK